MVKKDEYYIDISKEPVYDYTLNPSSKGLVFKKSDKYYIQTNNSPMYEKVEYNKDNNNYKLVSYKSIYTDSKPIKNPKIIEGVNSSYIQK